MADQKELTGALFHNDKKGNDRAPEYKGSATVGGIKYWLSAWVNTPKSGGKKYMSLSFQIKEERNNSIETQNQDSELPF